MARTTYNNSSLYFQTPQTSFSLDLWTPRDIPAFDTDSPLVIPKIFQFKPDLLAYDLYKDSRLWWVFTMRNKDLIIDPIWDFVDGLEIMVTEPGALKSLLNV